MYLTLACHRRKVFRIICSTVKNNFRICLVSAEGSLKFQKRCRDFPSLITCLNYTWIPHWSKNMLVDHAHYHINGMPLVGAWNLKSKFYCKQLFYF